MKRYLFVLTFTILLLNACNQVKNENQLLKDSVIAAHDSIMPNMSQFVRRQFYIDTLLVKMDSLKSLYPALDTAQEKIRLYKFQQKIAQATDGMSKWMHEFEPSQGNMSDEELKNYLREELKKMEELQAKFRNVEEESQEILAPFN